MKTLMRVGRFYLADWPEFVTLPWLIQGFVFALDLVVFAVPHVTSPASHGGMKYAGALATIYIVFSIVAGRSISKRLPLALALGVSRRSFYTGTALVAAALAAADGLVLTVLQPIEAATGGWGMHLHFFRVPFLLDGPWYLTWLTSFVGLALMFVYGMWCGLVYRRWNMFGVLTFAAIQMLALAAGLIIASRDNAWHGVGHFFTTLTIGGLTGALAVIAVAVLAGGYATIRRVTV